MEKLMKRGELQNHIPDYSFKRRYLSALEAVGVTLKKEKPDYILALSRKGPRLLELLNYWGIWVSNIPIITEKAIDFIPAGVLKGKKIIIFDDIIISGTSLKNLVLFLTDKYDIEIKIVCVAIDEDTIAFKKDENENYYIASRNSHKFYLDYKISLKKDERFIFCNEIVRSFVVLNKPYDIDYPIFYTSFDPDSIYSLLTQEEPDKAFNITTIHQSNKGFNRYSFIPTKPDKLKNKFDDILQNIKFNPHIYKVRGYFDRNKKKTTFAPIVTFSVNKKYLLEEKIFSDSLQICNELCKHIKPFIDKINYEKALYRFLWFLINYLYGVMFIERNFNSNNKLKEKISKVLHKKDICYLFGPFVTDAIIEFLGIYNKEVRRIMIELNNKESREIEKIVLKDQIITSIDKKRNELYNDIESYIKTHIKIDDPLSNQLATIFEGLYYFKEIPSQNQIKQYGIQGDEHKRLKLGFNHEQIKEILLRNGAINLSDEQIDIKLSLATDFLVDAGIEIPIYYYDREDEVYERAYRYGEDGTAAKRFGYLIASSLKELFKYAQNISEKGVIPKIALEKIGVIFHEEIARTGLVDIIAELVNVDDRTIYFAPSYNRHGKILRVLDEAGEETETYMFTEWCKKEEIINYIPEGTEYNESYLNKIKFPDGYSPKLVPDDRIASFASLGILLYDTDRIIDKSKQSDYLIALTACSDQKSYLWAIREELRLYFKSRKYSLSLPLENIREYLWAKRYSIEIMKKTLDMIKQKSYSAAHAIKHKQILWEKVHSIINEIDDYFNNVEIEKKLLFAQNMKIYVDKIKLLHDFPIDNDLRQFRRKIEDFGELCLYLVTILKNLIELSMASLSLRETVFGNFHQTDLNVLNKKLLKLKESMTKWNEINKERFGNGGSIEIDNIKIFDDSIIEKMEIREYYRLIEIYYQIINNNYEILEKIYNQEYSFSIWKEKMKHYFPQNREDIEFIGIEKAINASTKCVSIDNKIHPKVGVTIIKDDKIICEAYRGEQNPNEHAEYTAIIKKCNEINLKGATLITTLEPCTSRKHPKIPCASHIINRGIKKVIIGMIDPNPEIRGKGVLLLQKNKIVVEFFSGENIEKVKEINKDFWDQEWEKYRVNLMTELGNEYNKYEKEIKDDFYREGEKYLFIKVFQELRIGFSIEELKTLCDVYLGIDYESLGGETKIGKITELIRFIKRERKITELLEAIKKFKPESWHRIVNELK